MYAATFIILYICNKCEHVYIYIIILLSTVVLNSRDQQGFRFYAPTSHALQNALPKNVNRTALVTLITQ